MPDIPLSLLWKVITTYHYRITGKRIWNLMQVGAASLTSKVTKRAYIWGHPLLLMVEPTNICNLKCPMCPSGAGEMTRPKGMMDFKTFQRAVDEIGNGLILIQFWNQGEPFINKEFLRMVRYAKDKGIPAMTSTNGHFIKSEKDAEAVVQSGLDEILISVDGLDQKTYEQYRQGGDLKTVLKGIQFLSDAKKRLKAKHPLINIQFLVMKHNQSQKKDMFNLANKMGADIATLKSAQVYSDEQADHFLPDDEHFRRYDMDGKHYKVKGNLPNFCQFLWHGAILNWDGRISPCCFDKDADFVWGNFSESDTSFSGIWKGKKSIKFRQAILKNRKQFEICNNCFEGMPQPYVKYKVL